jgi:type III secretory pathway lipoprotein EscJ
MSAARLCAVLSMLLCGLVAANAHAQASLVPTRGEAQQQRGQALSRDLARTVATMPGIVDAQVHVTLPTTPAFARPLAESPAASVLLHVDGGMRVDRTAVQRLIAGAVPGLDAAAIVVVEVPASSVSSPKLAWTNVGPFVVADASAGVLRNTLLALLTLQLALSLLLMRTLRAKRQRTEIAADSGNE